MFDRERSGGGITLIKIYYFDADIHFRTLTMKNLHEEVHATVGQHKLTSYSDDSCY